MKQFTKVASIYITVVSNVLLFLIRYKILKFQEFLEKFGKPGGGGLGRGGCGPFSVTREVHKAIFASAIQTQGGVYIR